MRKKDNAKSPNSKNTWGKLYNYCKRYKWPIIIACVLALAGAVMSIVGPYLISKIIKIIQRGLRTSIDTPAIVRICVALTIMYVVSAVFSYTQSFIMSTVTQRVTKKMRGDISRKINYLPFKYYDKTQFGDVLSRVTNDVDTVDRTLSSSVTSLIGAIALLIGSVLMMFITNAVLAISAILSTLIGFVFMFVIMRNSQKYFISQQKSLGNMNSHIEEVYSGHNVVRIYNATANTKKQFDGINNELYTSAWKSQFFSGLMMPIMGFIGNFGYVVVCIVGGALAIKGSVGIDVIIAFMMYVNLFTQPLSTLAQVATNMQSSSAACDRIFEFLDEPELADESHKTTTLDHAKGNVTFSHVQFGYNADRLIIKDFSAEVKAGQKVAIVGPTGAGKTTLVNLLMRFYELNGGDILIDGVSTRDLTRENVHDLFSMVLQDTWVYEASVKDNIIYSKAGVTDDQVVEACKTVGIDHFIRTLPHGYDTILDDSTTISAGQKQLLTIARAMIQDSPMLILDEATSSVDTRTEILIQNAMDKLTENRTSFVIAHRLSTIKNADIILVMRDGDIVEKGSHEELLKQNGFYADLYNSQFDDAEED